MVQKISRRVIRALRRLGYLEEGMEVPVATGYDALLDTEPELARPVAASLKQRPSSIPAPSRNDPDRDKVCLRHVTASHEGPFLLSPMTMRNGNTSASPSTTTSKLMATTIPWSGRDGVLLRLPPLRTVLATFTAYGSSQSVLLLRSCLCELGSL
ncbi:hypothetical protein NKDENANG_04115 [Candidatus Entotheonellaceae bacterium PAL068K]